MISQGTSGQIQVESQLEEMLQIEEEMENTPQAKEVNYSS